MHVELLLAPHCPNAPAARSVLTACLRQLGLDVPVRERVGDYPSPTILIDGVDVMTAEGAAQSGPACRLDLPTVSHVLAALRPGQRHIRAASCTYTAKPCRMTGLRRTRWGHGESPGT